MGRPRLALGPGLFFATPRERLAIHSSISSSYQPTEPRPNTTDCGNVPLSIPRRMLLLDRLVFAFTAGKRMIFLEDGTEHTPF